MLKKTCFALALVLIGSQAYAEAPDFKAYAVPVENVTLKGPLKGANDQVRQRMAWVKTKAQKPNFAGHYVLDSFGCGTGCMASALVDLRTGQVYRAPFHEPTHEEKSFRVDSRLVEFSKYNYYKPNSPEMMQVDGLALWDEDKKEFRILKQSKPYKMEM
ncbi:hypothetical protein G7017_03825 [Pseudomonas fulva]|uniref:Uncharacterized protein n=1 Tax=Pseudomonas paracarnis TaxID=2750625 RepID=A0ABU6BQ28_9PSED|nr:MULTISPECIES: hypothetical protein [Pseudomonas]MBA1220032.1 hypothetical protein [Pseudomonas fulva]MDG9889231.1 hypothetical protein [Pseudomonas juntendi]MEB3782402.1 hypothetical protein [Pseudomonas paracarnis]